MMWMTTMNPETRRLIKVNPEEAHATARMFDLLLGKDLEAERNLSPKTVIVIWTRRTFPDGKIAVENGWNPQAASLKCGYDTKSEKDRRKTMAPKRKKCRRQSVRQT